MIGCSCRFVVYTVGLHACFRILEASYVFTACFLDTRYVSCNCRLTVAYGGIPLFLLRFSDPIHEFVKLLVRVLNGLQICAKAESVNYRC
jgi:hypothetical protein